MAIAYTRVVVTGMFSAGGRATCYKSRTCDKSDKRSLIMEKQECSNDRFEQNIQVSSQKNISLWVEKASSLATKDRKT